MFARAIVIVLDSVGIGELPDASLYEDQGSNTLGNIAAHGAAEDSALAAMGLSKLAALKARAVAVADLGVRPHGGAVARARIPSPATGN